MRKDFNFASNNINNNYKIIAVDDEQGIIDSLSVCLKRAGYNFVGITNPIDAIDLIKKEHFDLMILDFIMVPYNGEEVVKKIREFNKELYILLLTGHKDLAPPLETIKKLDIQGYCEKSNKFDQLLLLVESGIKSINQMNEIKKINQQLLETNQKLEYSYMHLIETLRVTVDAKDTYTKGHSDRVAKFAELIGQKLNLSEQELKRLHIGGLLHDIGKIGIHDSILQKESKLTSEEFDEIKKHPEIGVRILETTPIFKNIIPIIKHHHERYDGSGYPSNLKGQNIPFMARIMTIADSFDAMASKRKYQDSLPLSVIKQEFKNKKGIQFDPELTDIFLNILENEYDKIKLIQDTYTE